jgi:putative membrane protein
MKLPRLQVAMISTLAALLLAVQIQQPYPTVAPLHHIPTLILLLASPFILRRWPMSNGAVISVVLFFALHTIGGRYTYSNVPYDTWSRSLFGLSLDQIFGFTRNNYDRLVHFSYGLLAVYPIREFLNRHLGVTPRLSLYIAVESVIAVSALYELFEWFLSMVLGGAMAADYNGQQGDFWDAQKDMALATIGAFVSTFVLKVKASRPSIAAAGSGRAGGG